MALTSASSALAIDMILPAFASMRPDFGLAPDATNLSLTITVFIFGTGIGQLFYGPIADAFGRKPVLYGALTLYAIAAVASALAPSLTVLYAARFVWGLASAGPRVLSQAIVRDRFAGDEMARVMTLIQSAFFLAPVLAPLIGAGLVAVSGWRTVMAVGALTAIIAIVWSSRLDETLAPEDRRESSPTAILGAFRLVATNKITMAYAGAVTMDFAAFFSFLGSLELVIGGVYDRSDWFVPYFSMASVLFAGVAVLSNRMLKRIPAWRWALMAGVGFVASAAALLAVTVAMGGKPPFILWLIMFTVVNLTHVAFFPTGNSLALEPMGAMAGTAASVIGFMTAVGGGFLASFIDRAIGDDVMPIGIGYFAFGVASLLLQLWARRVREAAS